MEFTPFYRTLSPIGAAALLPPMKTREVEQGKRTADHLMPLGFFLIPTVFPDIVGPWCHTAQGDIEPTFLRFYISTDSDSGSPPDFLAGLPDLVIAYKTSGWPPRLCD